MTTTLFYGVLIYIWFFCWTTGIVGLLLSALKKDSTSALIFGAMLLVAGLLHLVFFLIDKTCWVLSTLESSNERASDTEACLMCIQCYSGEEV